MVQNATTEIPLEKCAWMSLYPAAVLLLEAKNGQRLPPSEIDWDLPTERYREDFNNIRATQILSFHKFLHDWGFAGYLLKKGIDVSRGGNDTGFSDPSESLFGFRVYSKRAQLEPQMLRWRTAPEIRLGDQTLAFSRIVASRGIDFICSELFSNAFTYGLEGNENGFVAFITKLIKQKSARAALRADEFRPYLTDAEKQLYTLSRDVDVPLLELIVADTGLGLSGQRALTSEFMLRFKQPPINEAALLSFALDGRYSSKKAEQIAKEWLMYPTNAEDVMPEIHGLAGIGRFIKETGGYWRIHCREAIAEQNLTSANIITDSTFNSLRAVGVEEKLVGRLGNSDGVSVETVGELDDLMRKLYSDIRDDHVKNVIRDAIVTRYQTGVRIAHGCIHHILIPLLEPVSPNKPPTKPQLDMAERLFQPYPTSRPDAGQEFVSIDIAKPVTFAESPKDYYASLVKLLQLEDSAGSLTPMIINVGAMSLLPENIRSAYCAIFAHCLQRQSSKRAVFLSGLDRVLEDEIVKLKCIQKFFLDRRVIPVIELDINRDHYKMRILCAVDIRRIEPQLLGLLNLKPFQSTRFADLLPEDAEMLWQVCSHNEGLFEVTRDVRSVIASGRVRIEGKDRETTHLLFGGMELETFIERLRNRGGVAISEPGKVQIIRYNRPLPRYFHLSRILWDESTVDRIVRWMENVLCHHAKLSDKRAAQGSGVVFVAVLQPAIELTKLLIERSWCFARAEIHPIRGLDELSWEAPWCMRLAGKSVIGVIDLCDSYETIDKITGVCEYLEVPHIINMALIGKSQRDDAKHKCVSFSRFTEEASNG